MLMMNVGGQLCQGMKITPCPVAACTCCLSPDPAVLCTSSMYICCSVYSHPVQYWVAWIIQRFPFFPRNAVGSMYILLALCSQSNLLLFSLPVAVMWFVVYFKPLKYTSWYILVFLLFLPTPVASREASTNKTDRPKISAVMLVD